METITPSTTSLITFIARLRREATTNRNGGAIIWAADEYMLEAIEKLLNDSNENNQAKIPK